MGNSMDKMQLTDFSGTLPDRMPVSVIMEKKPSSHAWIDYSYRAIGVVSSEGSVTENVVRIHENEGVEHFLFSGLSLKLHRDECESYYHNLMSPEPGCFIVASETDDVNEMPSPYLVSLSFDEVHAYLEGDEQVYAVAIPPELYKWTEAYILTHYVATKKTKRKLTDWKQKSKGRLTLHHDTP
jgi:hypothetical protein